MTFPEPNIRINVDVTNPGQFFACCGLLELADRLWSGAEGWFTADEFCVLCSGSLHSLLDAILKNLPEEVLRVSNALDVKPLFAPLRFSFERESSLTLDAWVTITTAKGAVISTANPPWNFWSGQQTSLRIWTALRAALIELLKDFDPEASRDLFQQRLLLSGRFGFDPGPAWNALDVGFSPNEQGIRVESSPAVELLAAVGVQRFRPRISKRRDRFDYFTWGIPLTPSVAAAAAAGAISFHPGGAYRSRVVSRGQYAALGYSTLLTGGSDE
jgi:hypothetical protein